MPTRTAPPASTRGPSATRDAALNRIRLRHLQCFLAVAQHGNLRRAALALAITQPAVTKTLNELEDLLGKALFVRGRGGATLTAEAEAFMPHARASLQALAQAVDSVRRERAAPPLLRLGVLPTVAASFLPAVLGPLLAHWPLLDVRIATGRNAQLIEQLRAREVDAVIGRLADPELMQGVSFEHLYAEPVVIVARPRHPLLRTTARRGARPDLAHYPCVLPPSGTQIRQVADGFLARHGIAADGGRIETLDTALARALVLQGDHLWFTPLGAVQPDLASGTLVRLAPRLTPHEAVGLILRTEPLTSAPLQAFLAAARAHAARRAGPRKRATSYHRK
ncbi:MAG TPA: pca operon transcription factor PcaQ [Burkholderiaceae bacterium]|nr:pca operon transcription factor PcaQ [Burkholderiaceae bacterium]